MQIVRINYFSMQLYFEMLCPSTIFLVRLITHIFMIYHNIFSYLHQQSLCRFEPHHRPHPIPHTQTQLQVDMRMPKSFVLPGQALTSRSPSPCLHSNLAPLRITHRQPSCRLIRHEIRSTTSTTIHDNQDLEEVTIHRRGKYCQTTEQMMMRRI